MSFYDVFKDVLALAQKADNIELERKLIALSQMAQELQDDNLRLRSRVQELEKLQDVENDMESHSEPYFTLKSDSPKLQRFFCCTCWGARKKVIQMWYDGESRLHCPACDVDFSISPRIRKQKIQY